MRCNPIPLIAVSLLWCLQVAGQSAPDYTIYLKSGDMRSLSVMQQTDIDAFNTHHQRAAAPVLAIVQFETLPTESQKTTLTQAGIQLLDYIPNNAYTALIGQSLQLAQLEQWHIRYVAPMSASQKMSPATRNGIFPPHAVKVSGTVDCWINYISAFTAEQVMAELRKRNIQILSSQYKQWQTLAVRINTSRINELAALSFISFVQPAPGEMQWLNNYSRVSARSNVLSKEISVGGRGLKGAGVTIGIGDNSDPTHVDFTGRIISRAATPANYHGTHVSGTAGGAGIWKELYTGHAPKATLLEQVAQGVWLNAAAYYNDHRMVITNNSYGNVTTDCSYTGTYDNYSRFLDIQAISLPKVFNTFAVGNSGIGFPIDCSPYPAGFRSALGGMQSAKNILSVGNTYADGVIFPQSSRGPVKDGRIKPEITAQGAFVTSTSTFTDYSQNTGTSMANPAVAGTLALLYERYRQLNGAASDPDNVLMKAILCNTAIDKGNAGPDYIYGFGWLNGLRAVQTLEAGNYVQNAVGTGGNNSFDITVPANTAQLKVMLCWNDPAAAPVSSKALVNNLDLRLTTTAPATYLPWVLDSSATGVNLPAQARVDVVNNIEQVTVDNPTGTYTVHVSGTAVPVSAPQSYYVTYDILPISATLTFPAGGEKLIPGDVTILSWDAFGGAPENFTLEYTTDNGGTWNLISNSVPAGQRFFVWTVPNVPTNTARVRLTKNNTALVNTSDAFTILGSPTITLSAVQCEGYISIDWTAVPAATQYEVMMLQGDEMVSVATVSGATANYVFGGLSKDSVYWVTVRAINSGFSGRRGTAVFRQPNNGTCTGSISDNDVKADLIISPTSSGRRLTSTELGNAITVTMRIKNLDDQPSTSNLDVSYSIDGIPQQTQTISPVMAAGGTYDHSFTTTANLSATGAYTLSVNVTKAGDPITANNTLVKVVKQLDNAPIILPFTDNFDAAPIQSYTTAQMGLQNLDRYDFVNNTIYGRVRTFINTGIAYSGNRAITIDAERYNAGTIDSLSGTFNIDLTGYNPATEEIRLDFRYKNHGQVTHPANKVWIRGSDADAWKEAYDLFANQNPVDGSYKFTSSIELSDLLAAAPVQTFTPSFQIRWGQYGQNQAADNDGGGGYTFDDIRLYKVTDDMQLTAINAPAESSCGLTAATPVTITVRNSSNTAVVNVPVRFRADGGAWNSESVPAIAANAAALYTFTTTANLAANGSHLIEAEVLYPTDTFHDNDTLSKTIINSPIITSFPYLEDFELSNGFWYTGGKLSTWEYGTPSANKIVTAASGSKAWKTRSNGSYNDGELSYLYSPCFDLTGMTNPTLSFSLAFDLEDCGATLCDGAYMEYSTDGNTWSRLGANGQGVNWYNKAYTGNNLWSGETLTRWRVATIPMSVTGVPIGSMNQMRFRFVMTSDPGVNKDGIAVDDIHVYDNINGIYDGATMGAPVTQTIGAGVNNWVDFLQGGKLVASVHPAGQEMGATAVRAYINAGAVRYTGTQYYHDRNITIQPGAGFLTLTDSVRVRFYFMDTETEALINATGCTICTKPASAYELGVSKYSDPDDNFENGSLIDDNQGVWTFFNAATARKVPFDKGYYAEFKVNNFSEFWLNNGGFNNNTPLPLQLLRFNAQKKPNSSDVLLDWITASEFNTDRFEVEVARGNLEYQLGRFVKLGEVRSAGTSVNEQRYTYTDVENGKTGVRYYRLKMIDQDGSSKYSPVRPVVFKDEIQWQVNPNPSSGLFNVLLQATAGETIHLKVYDIRGKLVKEQIAMADGFVQKIQVNLSGVRHAAGLYLLEATAGERKQTFRILRQ
ncbi:MAG: S8 family serine peptidase [Bacteroidetes bacterium]|nr:S8 family serine peptidase [Bacteroidota bacterium]